MRKFIALLLLLTVAGIPACAKQAVTGPGKAEIHPPPTKWVITQVSLLDQTFAPWQQARDDDLVRVCFRKANDNMVWTDAEYVEDIAYRKLHNICQGTSPQDMVGCEFPCLSNSPLFDFYKFRKSSSAS